MSTKSDIPSIIDDRPKSKKYYVYVTGIAPSIDKNYFESTSSVKVVAMKQKEWMAMIFNDKYDYKCFIRNYNGWKIQGHILYIIRINKRVFNKIIENPNNSKKYHKTDLLNMYLYDKGYYSEII